MIGNFDLYNVSLDGSKLIEASAGTGKTYTLSGLYIRYIVEKKLLPEQILVLTFTNAATAELKSRLRAQLLQCKNHLESTELVDRSVNPQLHDLYESYRHNDDCLQRIKISLSSFDCASVYTINGFCQKVIDDYNSDCGSPVFNQLINQQEYITRFVYDYWRKNQNKIPFEFAQSLPDLQEISKKINSLMAKRFFRDVPPLYKLEEIKQDYQDFIQLKSEWNNSQRELMDYLLCGDFNGRVYNRKSEQNYINDIDKFFYNLNNKKTEKFHASYIESKLNKGKSPEKMKPFFRNFENFNEKITDLTEAIVFSIWTYVKNELDKQLREQGLYTYNDQIKVVADSVNSNPGLVSKIASQWQCVMVDEFQDTDLLQYQIFSKCFTSDTHSVVYVGDPKQAIYDFRGADVFVYLYAKQHIRNIYGLNTNWRCSEAMLQITNDLFNSDNVFGIDGMSFNPSRPKNDQSVQLSSNPLPLAIIDCDKNQRAENIAQEIKRILTQETISNNDGERAVTENDIAILVKNNQEAIELYEYLLSHNLKVSLWSESGVFATETAKQLYYLIRAIINPSRSNIFTVLHGMFFKKTLNEIHQLDAEQEIRKFINYRVVSKSDNIHQCLRQIIDENDIYSHLLPELDGERNYTDILHLMELILKQQEKGHNYQQIFEWFALQIKNSEATENDEERKRRLESDGRKISIMTMHKSKGLEFSIVFLPFAESVSDRNNNTGKLKNCLAVHDINQQGIISWSQFINANATSLEEKKSENIRVLYVALTRAKHRVYIGWDSTKPAFKTLPIVRLYENLHNKTEIDYRIHIERTYEDINSENIKIPELHYKEFNRTVSRPETVYSFSSLSRKQPLHTDIIHEEPQEINYDDFFQFPKGSKSGTLQHKILECISFKSDEILIRDEVIKQLKQFDFNPGWQKCLSSKIYLILNTPLWENGCKLSEIENKIVEMEFVLPVQEISNDTISSWLSEHRNKPVNFIQENLKGYLIGYIDLIIEYKNKYYIIDYKSNYLGSEYNEYTNDNLLESIESHYYDLQFLLYTAGFIRFLQTKIENFDYDSHFGGIAYIYTRGVNGTASHGIYHNKPDARLIQKILKEFNYD